MKTVNTGSNTHPSSALLVRSPQTPWEKNCQHFLESVSPTQRSQVKRALHEVHQGGGGLRNWVAAITWRAAIMPQKVPESLIKVYFNDPEAVPLHDCEGCGLAIPVRPSRLYGMEGEPDEIYFPTCPACGSRTGLFSHFTSRFERDCSNSAPRKPR